MSTPLLSNCSGQNTWAILEKTPIKILTSTTITKSQQAKQYKEAEYTYLRLKFQNKAVSVPEKPTRNMSLPKFPILSCCSLKTQQPLRIFYHWITFSTYHISRLQIIILDEPTAGVDPVSRRQMWRILQRARRGKVLLLTTHFMDEADILGDRKAVISKGRVS